MDVRLRDLALQVHQKMLLNVLLPLLRCPHACQPSATNTRVSDTSLEPHAEVLATNLQLAHTMHEPLINLFVISI
jgi:hypothetical protein